MDLRNALNLISDVVANRPRPLRQFDQIFMKSGDMLLQTDLICREFADKDVIFVGDGDAIGLCAVYLKKCKIFSEGPTRVHVLDFDERVVRSIERFAKRFDVSDRITAELYNVADPLPVAHWQKFGGYYTNPPFGQRNEGASVLAFMQRGVEACGEAAKGCLVIADDAAHQWSQKVLQAAQKQGIDDGYYVSHLVPKFHKYHLDDHPDLTSCSLFLTKLQHKKTEYSSLSLGQNARQHFYGKDNPLTVRYVKDLTDNGNIDSKDHHLELFL